MYIDRKRVFDDVYEAFAMMAAGSHVSVYDAETQVTHWCPNAIEVFGLPGEYFDQGAYNWEDNVHPEDKHLYTDCMMNLTIGKVNSYDLSYRVRIYDGSYILCHNKGTVIRGENGMPSFIGGVVLNDEVLGRMCPLTGLRNQTGFLDDIEEAVDGRHALRMLIIGLRDFGDINNSYGYTYGNRYIRKFSELLNSRLPENCRLYRLNDVKFVITSDSHTEDDLLTLLADIGNELSGHFVVDGILHKARISGSVLTLEEFDLTAYEIKDRLLKLLTEAKGLD